MVFSAQMTATIAAMTTAVQNTAITSFALLAFMSGGHPPGRVEGGVDEAAGLANGGVDARDEPGPQRRHRACTADRFGLPIDEHFVSGEWVGVSGDIGYPSAGMAVTDWRR